MNVASIPVVMNKAPGFTKNGDTPKARLEPVLTVFRLSMHVNKSNADNPQGSSGPPHQVGVTTMLELVTKKMNIHAKHEAELTEILSQVNAEASRHASVSCYFIMLAIKYHLPLESTFQRVF